MFWNDNLNPITMYDSYIDDMPKCRPSQVANIGKSLPSTTILSSLLADESFVEPLKYLTP